MADLTPQCSASIEGPDVGRGRRVVAWRRRCQKRTRHESGLCPYHRRDGTARFVGEAADLYQRRMQLRDEVNRG